MSGLIIPGGLSQVPQEVIDRLKAIDPRLYIRPTQRQVFDSSADASDRPEMQWMWYVVLKWHANDPRWRMVQNGQTDPEFAFDMLGQIPVDCPLEQVPGYLARQLKPANGVARKICDDVAEWNRDQQIRNGAVTSEFAQELFEANAGTLFRDLAGKTVPRVFQHNPAQTGSKNKPKEA